jgi:VWFA-related protein
MLRRSVPLAAVLVLAAGVLALGVAEQEDNPVLWPEQQREFLQDGPAWLLDEETLGRFLALELDEREAFIKEFLGADLLPESALNELEEGIRRRRLLVRREFLSPFDARARLLFLHGPPEEIEIIECGATYMPIQIWLYPGAGQTIPELVLYRPKPGAAFRLWLPLESKRVLYTDEAEYYMDQYYAVGGKGFRGKPDRILCDDTERLETATGVVGLFEYMDKRPTNQQLRAFLAPPSDLAAWARKAAATPVPEEPEVPIESLAIFFPERNSQRIVTRFYLQLPVGVELPTIVAEEGQKPEVRLDVTAILEQEGRVFDEFKARFKLQPVEELPIVLALDRALRPNREFVVRFRIEDEVGGGRAYVAKGFRVPTEHERVELPPPPEDVMVALADDLASLRIAGHDSLVLVPPNVDVAVAVWRAEALVTGQRIAKVTFSVDDKAQLTRRRPPWTAEVKLADYPTEQIVKAEGFDAEGNLVDSDEVILNQPTGALRVRILEPGRGSSATGTVKVRAEVTVPENRRVEVVEFRVNDAVQATADRPPWTATVEIPGGPGELAYLAVVAVLDDASQAEDVRFLNSPQFMEEVDVRLVELFTTVTDRAGNLVKTLQREDFEILEDGRRQEIRKFELVEDLPLTVGIAIDSSGSMDTELPEAQQAAMEFLTNVITLRDRVFALTFSGRPVLLVPPTDDLSAVRDSLKDLRSTGMTTLHDALVTSLYYFRGVRGRRALIILSDGEDTASHIPYHNALEYARRAGVVIYTIGLNIGQMQTGIRGKLKELAEETGGRVFFINQAQEMRSVYTQIEEELRSQYLLTFSSDRPPKEGEYRTIDVKVRGKYKARTMKGYIS